MIERTILSHLVFNEEYSRKVLPFLKPDYFQNGSERLVYELIETYTIKYNGTPTREALTVELENKEGIPENQFGEAREIIAGLASENSDGQWLLDQTEKFCQKKSLFNAIMRSITIMDGQDKDHSETAIPQILSDALAVSFNTSIGHDYLEDADQRFNYYHTPDNRIPFDLPILNKATGGGIKKKTLNILLAGTGVGKTLVMCHLASMYMMAGLNVLYITLEMAEMDGIAERIDANLLDIDLDELRKMPEEMLKKRLLNIKAKTTGKLKIKEYPTSSAGVGHFRHLLNELKLKSNFKPDVIFVDYLNICTSVRFKAGANVNSYTMVKAIAEELRGLAVEFDVPIWSATQTNREGYGDSDVELTATSESFGLPMTADLFWAVMRTEELDKLGQLMWKQLKSRYADKANMLRFVTGVDRANMRLFEVEQAAQEDIVSTGEDEGSPFDKGSFGVRLDEEKKAKWKKILV